MIVRALSKFARAIAKGLQATTASNVVLADRPIEFLPPHLPSSPDNSEFLPDDHLLADLPCTRYWHKERRQTEMGLPPPGIPHWLRRFDWLVGWEHGWANTDVFPAHVFCHPNATSHLLRFLRSNFEQARRGSFLVVGGEDTRLSSQDPTVLDGLLRYFDRIYYEAFDCEIKDVGIMPIGLTEFYLRGFEDVASRAIYGPKEKESLVLSAFGKFWPELNETIDDRQNAAAFWGSCEFATRGPFPQDEYYAMLAKHAFMACPRGNGVQAPKITEAFLTGCTPIVTDSLMARALVNKGAPLLVVDRWSSVSEELLRKKAPAYESRAREFFGVVTNLDEWWKFSFES